MGLLFDDVMFQAWKKECCLQKELRGASVYEATNVALLIKEAINREGDMYWNRHVEPDMPKRPPNDLCWIEWNQQSKFFSYDIPMTHGVYCTRAIPSDGWPKVTDDEECFNLKVFERLDGRREGYEAYRGVPVLYADTIEVILSCESKLLAWRTIEAKTPADVLPSIKITVVKVEDVNDFRYQQQQQMVCAIVFYFFALLHCRNIETETITGRPQTRREFRQKRPPKTSYHVLRLNLPSTLRPRGVVEETEEEKRRMRLHLCRGHFKNLQHDRYKNKGWHWWPAHWKGDAELGTVDKIYKAGATSE